VNCIGGENNLGDALTFEQLEAIRCLDTCSVSNAIETFDLRLRNEGFADARVRCVFPHLPPVIGYAVTGRIRCGEPPMSGGTYFDRTDWWNYLITIPQPRIVVMEDVDSRPGIGAMIGEVHANILKALGCTAYVSNGGVRDLQGVEPLGFQFFAGNVAVSHAYAHISDFGGTVEIGGLKIVSGDLLHGDRHGLQSVPTSIAARIPAVADRLRREDERVIALCKSPDFSVDRLRQTVLKGA
jgi:4-hydroxy-4-methyl-2-oxoglutarate aldolase